MKFTGLKQKWPQWTAFAFFFVSFLVWHLHAHSKEVPPFTGSIYINLKNESRYVEYEVKGAEVLKKNSGKVRTMEKEDGTYVTDSSPDFHKLYLSERLYRYMLKDKLLEVISKYDFKKLEQVRLKLIRGNATEHFVPLLAGPGEKLDSLEYPYRLSPDRQLSWMIFYNYSYPGILINLKTGELSYPFGGEELLMPDWSRKGNYIAYCAQDSKQKPALSVYGIGDKKTLFQIDLKKYPADIAWSPDQSRIAVLASTRIMGLWPWELLAAAAGHPYFYHTFYLEIYDLQGQRIFQKKITGNFRNGTGRLIWK